MSTRYNTGNPIESSDVRDMSDNAKNFDEFSNSMSDSFTDRIGRDRQTIEGSIRKAGFQPASFDFATGGTLVSVDRNKAVFNPEPSGDNNWYAWQGALPKTIQASSTPATSGGLGDSAWKPVTNNVLAPSVREALRLSYAEAGFNLVDGSFQRGFTLVYINDVALDESTGKAYSGPTGVYPPNTNPSSGGFVVSRDGSMDSWGAVKSSTVKSDAARNSCFNYAAASTYPAMFSSGNYLLESGYTLDTEARNWGLMVRGDGIYSTFIKFKPSTTGDVFLKVHRPASGAGTYGTEVSDISVENIGSVKGVGLDFKRSIYSHHSDVILKALDVGAKLDECFGSKYANFQLWGCRVNLLLDSSQNNANTFQNLQVYNATEIGAFLRGCTEIAFPGVVCEGNPIGFQLRGMNRGITWSGYFEGNTVSIDIGGGCSGATTSRAVHRLNDGNTAFKITNSNTQSALTFSSVGDEFVANNDNVTYNIFDFTDVAGSDIVALTIREPKFVKRTNTVMRPWVSGGVSYLPPARYFVHSDIPVRDLASLTATIGAITQKSNTLIYALDNKVLRVKLDLTLNSVVASGSQWVARFALDSGVLPARTTIIQISVFSGSVSTIVAGNIVFSTDGNVTMAFPSNVSGFDIAQDFYLAR